MLRPYDGDALSAVRPAGHRLPAWRGLRASVRLIILDLGFDARCERLQCTISRSLPPCMLAWCRRMPFVSPSRGAGARGGRGGGGLESGQTEL